jgi:hypothetical protein
MTSGTPLGTMAHRTEDTVPAHVVPRPDANERIVHLEVRLIVSAQSVLVG